MSAVSNLQVISRDGASTMYTLAMKDGKQFTAFVVRMARKFHHVILNENDVVVFEHTWLAKSFAVQFMELDFDSQTFTAELNLKSAQ